MARIYVSSTWSDLKEFREQVRLTLRRLGHEDVAMEYYGASDERPLDRCLRDVAESDLYLGIFAWRYGFIPDGYDQSITELEFRKAVETGKDCLIFLINEDVPWLPSLMERRALDKINALRKEFHDNYVVSHFSNLADLITLVSQGVMTWEQRNGRQISRSPRHWGKQPGFKAKNITIAQERQNIFISYSHKDRRWLNELQTMLHPLIRNRAITIWDDTQIKAGDKWEEEIRTALAAAKVAILLVSPHFLASSFISDHEVPPILEAAASDGLTILWIAVSPSLYKETEIAHYQSASTDPSRPLDSFRPSARRSELVRICERIKFAAEP